MIVRCKVNIGRLVATQFFFMQYLSEESEHELRYF